MSDVDSLNGSSTDFGHSWTSPGAGISGGYNNGTDQTFLLVIIFSAGLAMYNSAELVVCILLTFRQYQGLYFWSLLISSIGIIPYALGCMLKFGNYTTEPSWWVAIVLITIGWYPMVTGQSVVLWSRLHLVVSGERGANIIRWTKWMIIVDAIVLHIPTSVLTFGSNGTWNTPIFESGYNIMEKIQMAGFFIQEVVLSSIYIVTTVQILRKSLQPRTRVVMKQLIAINVMIIIMDLALVGLEWASLYILQILLKAVFYSIKLKLEFAILGKLVSVVVNSKANKSRQDSVGFATPGMDRSMNIAEFVDLTRVCSDLTNPSQASGSFAIHKKGCRVQGNQFELQLARFQYIEDLTTLREASYPPSDRSCSRKESSLSRCRSQDGAV